MEVITGAQLIGKLNSLSNNVHARLWIAVPFIGSLSTIRKILGRTWFDNDNINVRLITDISCLNRRNYETVKRFYDVGKVKDILGLHAKVYIIDNCAIVTSANLTATAFSKRREIGIFLSEHEAESVIRLFSQWWENLANSPSLNEIKRNCSRRNTNREPDEPQGLGLATIWGLPTDPGEPRKQFSDYAAFLGEYRNFAETYERIQRVWPQAPLYFETDSFLNYLFHEESSPSHPYIKRNPRPLTREERINEIKHYAKQFKRWIDGEGDDRWRESHSRTIRELLSEEHISRINEEDAKKVVEKLNCMAVLALNKVMFLNPRNNKIETIRTAWKTLLHGRNALSERMSECDNALFRFGKSSIQELLGFYYPNKYPLRNTNSNAGLRFFGYDVSVY